MVTSQPPRWWRSVPLRPRWEDLIDHGPYDPAILGHAMQRLLDGEHGCPIHSVAYPWTCGYCQQAEVLYGWTGDASDPPSNVPPSTHHERETPP